MSLSTPLLASPAKENVDSNTPTRQTKTSPESPVHVKNSMWDSNDPMRNPPPLPLSPRMLKINSSMSRGSSPTTVGKLQLTQVDNSDIEHQLKRLADNQVNLKGLLLGIDTSVKQTQIDLDNLVARSLNNNSHLKDLLQNVNKTDKDADDFNQKRFSDLLQSHISPLRHKLENIEELKRDLTDYLHVLKASDTDSGPDVGEINTSMSHFKEQVESLVNSHQLLSKEFGESRSVFSGSDKAIRLELNRLEQSISSSTQKLHQQLEALQLEDHFHNSNELSKNVLSRIDSIVAVYLSKIESALDSLGSQATSSSEKLATIKAILQSAEIYQQPLKEIKEKIEAVLHEQLKVPNSQLMERLEAKFSGLMGDIESLKSTVSKYDQDQAHGLKQLHQALTEKLTITEGQSDKVKEEEEIKRLKAVIEKKELEIQLKDKDIERLRQNLSEYSNKEELSQNIIKLAVKSSKLETRFGSLNEAYNRRYEEFKRLSEDHEALISKLSSISLEKLTSIMSNAALSYQTTQEEHIRSLPNPKAYVSNRVLSTNSYLGNSQFGTPKGIKNYDLIPIDNEDDEDKENIA